MASRFAEHASEMHSAAASRNPNSMMEVREDLRAIQPALADVAGGLRAFTTKALEEYPMHPGVAQAVGTVHEIVLKAEQAAADIVTAMNLLHEEDLKRHESPRTNEQMWDVRA